MQNVANFYIDGAWVAPVSGVPFDVINPATEQAFATIALGGAADVDRAVAAARAAFPAYAELGVEQRCALIERIAAIFETRLDEIAETITLELGAPRAFARDVQAANVVRQFRNIAQVARSFDYERSGGGFRILREPIGVCGLITAWNWPLSLIAMKLAPALATGCTVVLKPSEHAPLSSVLLAEILHAAGTPPGVFNLVQGDGAGVGAAIASHPDVDMISFTGSTRGGIAVAKAAADSVKRVQQELGGKSAHIILPGADLSDAVPWGIHRSYMNSGQSCEAPTRMFVHRADLAEAYRIARNVVDGIRVGDPQDEETKLGPLVNEQQFARVQRLIASGISEGATLVAGGPGKPDHVNQGYFVRPTIFGDVRPDMEIAREEIFGPVLSIFGYDTESEAIALANASVYGLASYVHGPDADTNRSVARRLRSGRVYLNGAPSDLNAPFGGYKQSGNGRENGVFALDEYLETKAVLGY